MKTSTLSALVIAGIGAMLGPASSMAQSSDQIRVNVPFEFLIGSQSLPAGKYVVRTLSTGVTQVYNLSGSANQLMVTSSIQSNSREPRTCLVFRHTGDSYFLSEIWSGTSTGKTLPVSKAEREVIAKAKPVQAVTLYAAKD